MRYLAFLLVSMLTVQSIAQGSPIVATLTADNHYVLYYGKADGSNLTRVGRNEVGTSGSPGTYNWSLPETWSFGTPDYLYVAAWDDGGQQGWIGQFQLPSSLLLSNISDWEFYVSANANPGLPGGSGDLNDFAVSTELAAATWAASIAQSAPNSSAPYPWGVIAGIDGDARWIWHDTLASSSTSDTKYVIFRSGPVDLAGAVPEPTTLAIWGTLGGLGLIAAQRRRRSA